MDRAVLENLLREIRGCSFATIDAENPVTDYPGVVHVVTGKRVLMFTNKHCSGYEQMVKRRLEAAGKNPRNFVLGDLPWGKRIPETPLIEHNGKTYLQVIELAEGVSKYLMDGKEFTPEQLQMKPRRHYGQSLPKADEVQVRCYNLDNIKRIALAGETLVDGKVAKGRSILRINA